MDWIKESKRLFKSKKPEHFTNYEHCEECFEHNQTLNASNVDKISLEELGNPGWDPICFCSDEGKKYYSPAFVRLTLESISNEFYLGQFLFHLESDGSDNSYFNSCSLDQRRFIADFIAYLIDNHVQEIELNSYEDEILRVSNIWSNA